LIHARAILLTELLECHLSETGKRSGLRHVLILRQDSVRRPYDNI
jgi:hypothetical protein